MIGRKRMIPAACTLCVDCGVTKQYVKTSLPIEGSVLVESALSLMVFMLLIFGAMEGGRLLQVQNLLTNAAREGARYGVTASCSTCSLPNPGDAALVGQIQAHVASFLAAGAVVVNTNNIVVNQVTVPPDPTTQYTEVIVPFPYQVTTIPFFSMTQIALTGHSIMRNETSP